MQNLHLRRGPGCPTGCSQPHFRPVFAQPNPEPPVLGLSICYSIVKFHNGVIHCDSPSRARRPPKRLPARLFLTPNRASEIRLACQWRDPERPGHGRRSRCLRAHPGHAGAVKGYKVTVTARMEPSHSRVHPTRGDTSITPFHVVFMDLTVPGGLGGMETQRELLKIEHLCVVKSIVCSGYSSDPVMANYLDCGFVGRLPKPFTNEDLLRAIRRPSTLLVNPPLILTLALFGHSLRV